jgi:ABC-2 type transport system permease protein
VTGLVAAEVRKLTSVRSTWILTAIGWLLVAVSVLPVVLGAFGPSFTGSSQQVADALAVTGGNSTNSAIVLVVGLLAMTTEFRHGTVGRTLQITPSRTRVLAAKLVAGSIYAVAYVVGALVVVFAVLQLVAAVQDTGLVFGSEAFEVGWQALVAAVLTALLGVGFGALVRAQVVAIVVALVWIFVVESLFLIALPDVGRWLPFQALNGLFIPEAAPTQMPGGAYVPLAGFTALVVFTAWVVTFTVGAGVLLRYRDV